MNVQELRKELESWPDDMVVMMLDVESHTLQPVLSLNGRPRPRHAQEIVLVIS